MAKENMSKLERLIQQYCPDGVEYVKLDSVANICRGTRVVKSQLSDKGYPVYQNCLTPMGYFERSNCNAGITFVICGGAAGNVGYTDVECWAADDCEFIIGGHQVINRYIYYYLMTKQNYLLSKVRKASIPRLSPSIIKDLEIPLPPLPVQEEIVRILDAFTELQAELQAELQKRKQQYNYYLDNLLNFKNINRGGYQAEVRWMKMSEVASFTYGYTSKAQDLGNVRYIRITDITDKGQLNPKNGKYVSLTEEVRPYLLKKGDLIMARTGATYGKTLYYNEDYPSAYASFLIKITLNQLVDSKYYWHFTRSSIYWEQANRLVGGGAQPQFNTGAISQVIIPLPSLEEQNRIVFILDRFDRLTNDLTSGLPAEIEKRRQQYEFYRDKLLTFKRKEA